MASKNNNLNTEWTISTDVYDIARSINALKMSYIDDKDETTLSLGIFGFISDLLTKEIQTDTIMTGIYGNEMFPSRAQLTKNVLTHAIYNSILDINAIPSNITVNFGIKVSDFNRYAVNNRFIIDHMCPLMIGEYEFHPDYDIIITRSSTKYNVYSAHYDMSVENRISKITQPYLNQPFVIRIGDSDYIVFQLTLQQVTISEVHDKIISDSIIDNKTFTFSFPDQLVDFDVYVEDNGVTTRLIPQMSGTISPDDDTPYCWYLFMSDSSIRINFDTKSYVPGINANIYIKVYSTLGRNGEFTYAKIDQYSEGLYVDLNSSYLGYKNISCYLIADGDCTGGQNSKTKEELQSLIPKAAVSRGSITTETDVANYFNLIDTTDNRLLLRKKVDNNISRVWYCYMLLKDTMNNIIPTNCLDMEINIDSDRLIECDDTRKVLPAGAIVRYDTTKGYCEIIDESDVPELYSDDYYNGRYYYYITTYNIVLNPDPLYTAFYLTVIKQNTHYTFNYVNENCELQFVANSLTFNRNLLTHQSLYTLNFKIAQSIAEDFGLYKVEDVTSTSEDLSQQTTTTVITNNMKCIIVLYKNDSPYRYKECELTKYYEDSYISEWSCNFITDNSFDDKNNLKLLDLNIVGKQHAISYGFFGENVTAKLYTLVKFVDGEYGRYDLDSIVPGLEGWTVTNIYEVNNGLKLFENYTGITNCKTVATEENVYRISKVPIVGLHYMTDEDMAAYFTSALNIKKQYIKFCLNLLENNMDVDYKFFNTYGPSITYTTAYEDGQDIGDVSLNMNFKIQLINSSDVYTKDDIIASIKEYIEDLYDLGNWHAPNMISTLMSDYQFNTRCVFIEFINYNDLGPGIQHILLKDETELEDPTIVPEFLNIRNRLSIDGTLYPDINVEVVTE